MTRPGASRDLLFGLLALQNGMVSRAQLVTAFATWTASPGRALADLLVEQNALDPAGRDLLEALAERHLKAHDNDPARSLAALDVNPSTRESLAAAGGPEVEATLEQVGSGPGDDPGRTGTFHVGTVTSEGQRFRVLRPHARGGLGAVFVALDGELNREVAVKQILDHHADDPVSRQRFLIEAEITGGLEHPGIVPVYGLGTYGDGRPYYAMRFIRGDSLKEAIERFHAGTNPKHDPGARSLALIKLLRRFLDLCNAIDYAHGRGVLHRDIKPGNVIVGKHGETLVVDWGLAKAKGQADGAERSEERPLMPSSASGSAETLPGSALGTPAYMSPEQARGDLEALGPHSDVYSLGATLYCLLTGRPPFEGPDVGAVLRSVQNGDFSPPRKLDPSLDASLEAVCLKAMATHPKDRYASARALADDVERWIADEPVSARREPLSARLSRWARRHRTAVAGLGLSLATAVILLAVLDVLVTDAQRKTSRALARVKEEQGRTAEALGRADANYRRARQAVEDYFTTVSEETLLDEPGMQPLREKLLRSALRYHEGFLRERAGDPSADAELAQSHLRFANISMTTGHLEEARPHVSEAISRFEALARRHPENFEHRRHLAEAYVDLGSSFKSNGADRDREIAAYREAVARFEPLLHERPGDTAVREGLAEALAVLGLKRNEQRGGAAEAGEILKRSRDLLRRLAEESPDSIRYRYRLAQLHFPLYAGFVGNRERQAEAIRSSQEALELLDGLIARSPNSPRFRLLAAQVHDVRGTSHARSGRFEEAIPDLEKAHRLLQDVVRTNPEIPDFRVSLGMVSCRLGLCLSQSGASEQALAPLKESREMFEKFLADRPGDTTVQGQYMGTLSTLGAALGRLDRYDESAKVIRRTMELLSEHCQRDPNNVFLRGELMVCRGNLGLTLTRAGLHREAVAAFSEYRATVREATGEDDWSHEADQAAHYRILFAYSLREIGRHPDAEREIGVARKLARDEPEALFEIARYDARGARLLARSGAPSPAVRALEDQAMDGLRRAVRSGFSDLADLRGFPDDLDTLRTRPDFKLLMMDLAMPASPFAEAR